MGDITHTPGPWRIMPYGDGDSLVIHDARGDWRVCFMATPGSKGDMSGIEANARLIAAAPDLLEALQDILQTIDAQVRAGIVWDPETVASARKALSLATVERK